MNLVVIRLYQWIGWGKWTIPASESLWIIADAFITEQLLECLSHLKANEPVQIPVYDFLKYQRFSDRSRKVRYLPTHFVWSCKFFSLRTLFNVQWSYNLDVECVALCVGECIWCDHYGGHLDLSWRPCAGTDEHEDLCRYRSSLCTHFSCFHIVKEFHISSFCYQLAHRCTSVLNSLLGQTFCARSSYFTVQYRRGCQVSTTDKEGHYREGQRREFCDWAGEVSRMIWLFLRLEPSSKIYCWWNHNVRFLLHEAPSCEVIERSNSILVSRHTGL